MDLVVAVVFEERVGDLSQTESLPLIDDQRHDGDAVQDDLAHLVGFEGGRRRGRRGRGRGVDVGGPGWSQLFPLVRTGGAGHYDVIRTLQMRLFHICSEWMDLRRPSSLILQEKFSRVLQERASHQPRQLTATHFYTLKRGFNSFIFVRDGNFF